MADGVAEQRIAPAQVALETLGVGIEQQLVGIEAVALLGLVGSVRTNAIEQARPRLGKVAVPRLVGVLAQLDAVHFAPAVGIEQTQLDPRGMRRERSEVDPFSVPARATRVGTPGPDGRDRLVWHELSRVKTA